MPKLNLIPHWSQFVGEARADDITTPPSVNRGPSDIRTGTGHYYDDIRRGRPSAAATAAVQSALGVTRRAFMLAEVKPRNSLTALLTPELLQMMAGSALLSGNAVLEIFGSGRGGGTELIPVPAFDVSGSIPRATWRYKLCWRSPDDDFIEKRDISSAGVIHVRYLPNADAPWYGVGPLQAAGLTAGQLADIERSLGHDARTPVSHLMPVPDQGTHAQREGLAGSIRDAHGQIVIEPTTSGGWAAGKEAAPRRELETSRTGPEAPASSIELREKSAAWVESALGATPGLFSSNAGANREGLRMFYHFTLLTLASLIQTELALKLGVPGLTISIEKLQAVDVSARSRAVNTLVQAGVPLAEALRLVGWTDVDLPEPEPEAEPEEDPEEEPQLAVV